ncbi:MAG: Serine/threonine-protein kinase PknD [Thermoanaerobaculia bacterium]|nr:Serine/threonine-protein kinase PknD [Thermoanaerobaculia bacterium]
MIGTILAGRYEVSAEIGRGGMGVVYRALDRVLEREVAVKVLPAANLTPEAVERFIREAKTAARLDHPGIVPVYDSGKHEEHVFFVMPLVPGASLRRVLAKGSLRRGDLLDVCGQVAEALAHSHAHGVVHRDVKPENIMVVLDPVGHWRARLMDFGLAISSSTPRLTRSGVICGTLSYLSPEQVEGRSVDARTDLYAMAAVLYEGLAGAPPFEGDAGSVLYRIVHERPKPPSASGLDIDPQLEELILRSLAKDPAQRPSGLSEFAGTLRRIREAASPSDVTAELTAAIPREVPRSSGREREVSSLLESLDAVITKGLRFVVVEGPAGAGKSVLIGELEKAARDRGFLVLTGQFLSGDSAVPYEGFEEALVRHFRGRSRSGARSELGDMADELVTLFPTLGEIEAFLSAEQESGASRVAAAGERDVVKDADLIVRAVGRISGGKSLLLVLENLHDAGISIQVLRQFLRRLSSYPILVVGTYRRGETSKEHPLRRFLASLSGDSRVVSLNLLGLSESDLTQLSSRVLGGPPDVGLVRALAAASTGNPLFASELLTTLRASGTIRRNERGLFQAVSPDAMSKCEVPLALRRAEERIFQRLPEKVRALLSAASVAGRSFDLVSVLSVSGLGEISEEDLESLLEEGILEEKTSAPGDQLSFASMILQDVAYADLPRRRRRSLHRGFGELLEKRFSGRPDRPEAELFRHFAAGDVPEKAVSCGLATAENAVRSGNPTMAADVATAVLRFASQEVTQAQTRLVLARAQRLSGEFEVAATEAEAAATIFEKLGDPRNAEAFALAAEAAWEGRSVERTRKLVEKGLTAASVGQDDSVRARLLRLGATLEGLRGDSAAAERLTREADNLSPVEERDRSGEIPFGVLQIPLSRPVLQLDPAAITALEEAEAAQNVFETLVRVTTDGRVIPWLASDVQVEEGGLRFRFHLRDGVRFHDGRILTSADVRWTFERFLREAPGANQFYLQPIRGASIFARGETDRLEGLDDSDPREVVLTMERRYPIFPVIISNLIVGILPEGAQPLSGRDWKTGLMGTGPFRVVHFEPGVRLELERNPGYWRQGLPRSEGLRFHFGLSSEEILDGFEKGRLSIASGLTPPELERLRHDSNLSKGYRESPALSTYFLVFSANRGPMADLSTRQRVRDAIDVPALVRLAGRCATPASSLIPPGLPGNRPPGYVRRIPSSGDRPVKTLEFRFGTFPAFDHVYPELKAELERQLRQGGFLVSWLAESMERSNADIRLLRWIADYPDSHSFAGDVIHSETGIIGSFCGSAELDLLIDEAQFEADSGARRARYIQMEDILEREVRLIPLFHENQWRLARPEVEGLATTFFFPIVNFEELRIRR